MRKQRLRALKSGWRALHGNAIRLDPTVAAEYNRRFYACLHGDRPPAWHLLRHLEGSAK